MPPSSVVPAGPATFADPADVLAALRRVRFARLNDLDRSGLPRSGQGSDRRAAAGAGGQRRQLLPDRAFGRAWASRTTRAPTGSGSPTPMPRLRPSAATASSTSTCPTGPPTGDTIDIHDTGGLLAGRRDLQRTDRNALAGQRRRRQLPLRDGSRHEGRDGQEDLRSVDGQLAARRGLRLRDRHLLRGRDERSHGLPHRRFRQPSRLRSTSASGWRGSRSTRSTRHLFVLTESAAPFEVWVLDTADALHRPRRLRRDERRCPRSAERRRQPGSRLQRSPLDQHPLRSDRLRVRIGRDRLVRQRHPVAFRDSRGRDRFRPAARCR